MSSANEDGFMFPFTIWMPLLFLSNCPDYNIYMLLNKTSGRRHLVLFLILGGKYLVSLHLLWFPDGSDGKESTCNAGDPSLVKNKKCLTVFNFNVLEHFANFSYSFQNTCTPNEKLSLCPPVYYSAASLVFTFSSKYKFFNCLILYFFSV